MRFADYSLWNPFVFPKDKPSPDTATHPNPELNGLTEEPEMADITEYNIPSAILTAALIEKSELTGKDLEIFAINTQRYLIRQMIAFKEKLETEEQ